MADIRSLWLFFFVRSEGKLFVLTYSESPKANKLWKFTATSKLKFKLAPAAGGAEGG